MVENGQGLALVRLKYTRKGCDPRKRKVKLKEVVCINGSDYAKGKKKISEGKWGKGQLNRAQGVSIKHDEVEDERT